MSRMATVVGVRHTDKVAVVRVDGPIGDEFGQRGVSAEGIEEVLRRAFDIDHLRAVAVVINSPGGSPAQSEYVAERIRQLSAEKGVKVFAFCEDMAASGGYWIACAADEIFAARTSLVGSIGVVSSGFGLQDLMSRLGIERRLYSAGKNKARMDMFSPESDDGYLDGELLRAAACYLLNLVVPKSPHRWPGLWPWPSLWWKPTNPRRDLVKAGALILAEIERLDRAAAKESSCPDT